MIAAELIEQLQALDPKTEVVAIWFTAADFENSDSGEVCSELAFRSAYKNAGDELWTDADYVLGREVWSAMGWNEPADPKDPCLHGCVCGGN